MKNFKMNPKMSFYFGMFLFVLIIVVSLYQNRLYMGLFNEMLELKNSLRSIDSNNPFLHKISPPLLPSIPTTAEEEKKIGDRGIYGGKGDKAHLGGFIKKDLKGISPALWNFMMGPLAVKSFIDVGCGRGFSSKYFLDNGARVLCVEGSHDAVVQSLLPSSVIREHDFTRGPWWPKETFDVAWSVEFIEHVGRQYMPNYFPIFKKSALIMVNRLESDS